MIENFRDGRGGVPVQLLGALWLLVSAALIWSGWGEITTLSGWDPDDQLRLVQLRDFLGGQSWFDTTQYRMNPPEGAPMHWSRLVELPLALLVLLFRPFFGQPVAEMLAGAAIPLLLLGWIAFMLSRIATRISSREAGVAAALIALSSGALLLQLRPMRIDHHGWQLAMAVLALSTLFWNDIRRAGIIMGLALAVWLHISLEGAPMTAAFFVLLGFRWVRDPSEGRRLFWTISSFVGFSSVLFFGTQPAGVGASTFCDTLSPPHLAAMAVAAVPMLAGLRFLPDDFRLRLAVGGLAGGGALAVLLFMAPQCTSGAFGSLDPLVREYWYSKVTEGLPVWHQPWRISLNLGAGLLCGVVSWFVLRLNLKRDERRKIDGIGFLLIYGLILSVLVVRTVSVATAFAIPVTAVLIALLFKRYRQSKISRHRLSLVAIMLLLLVPGAAVSALTREPSEKPAPKSKDDEIAAPSDKACQSAASVRALARLPKGRIVAPFDMGPMILVQTPHSVLASSHHRNEQAMHDHIQIFRSEPVAAHALLKARGIDYLVACPKEAELAYYVRKDPTGLWARLKGGNAVAGLQRQPNMGDGIQIWKTR